MTDLNKKQKILRQQFNDKNAPFFSLSNFIDATFSRVIKKDGKIYFKHISKKS
jgi:hypothetical protein